MKERPIPFSGAMVRALLAGTKTQTRRVVKHKWPHLWREPHYATGRVLSDLPTQPGAFMEFRHRQQDEPGHQGSPASTLVPCPYGQPGDRLWVREAFRFPESIDQRSPSEIGEKALAVGYPKPWCPTQFEADGTRRTAQEWRDFVTPPTQNEPGRLRAAMHMPRWASRILLEVTEVRVERLQDISEADARAEGITDGGCTSCGMPEPCGCLNPKPDARDAFAHLWMTINGADSWHASPWVWAVTFRRLA